LNRPRNEEIDRTCNAMPHTSSSSRLRTILVGSLLACSSTQSFAADVCDPSLRGQATNPYAYKQRGDRCEGVYAQDVSGAVLQVTSFTLAFEPFDLNRIRDLHLAWTTPVAGPTMLRAQGTRRRLYYRMDAVLGAGTNVYSWPTTVLTALGVRSREVGIVAWTTVQLNGRETTLYLPLRVGDVSSQTMPPMYRVEFVPGSELTEVFVTLAPVDSAGSVGAAVRKATPLGFGFYPAERPVEVPLPELTKSGIYYLEIAARIASGGDTSKAILIYGPATDKLR
jgi:hypothetical protein